MYLLNPIAQLLMRAEFAEGVLEVARLCNWKDVELQNFQTQLLEELARIDNLLYDVYDETNNKELAILAWETAMEDLRRWLSLILGVKIKYV